MSYTKLDKIAIYTTFYKGASSFISHWKDGVLWQTDKDFDLYVGLHDASKEEAIESLGTDINIDYIEARPNETPVQLRSRSLQTVVDQSDAVILTDIDDVMLPTRVCSARRSLEKHEIECCKMEVMEDGNILTEAVFDPGIVINGPILRNPFGLTNTAWRTNLLRKCLPVPQNCKLMDWLIATRAWSLGADIAFTSEPKVIYRQYAGNIARIVPPFTAHQVLTATRLVIEHYDLICNDELIDNCDIKTNLEIARGRVKIFLSRILDDKCTLDLYLNSLNQLPPKHMWWDCVANTQLEHIWNN